MSRAKLALASAACLLGGMFGVAAWTTMYPVTRAHEAATSATHRQVAAPRAPSAGVAHATQVTAADLWTAYMRDPAAADRQFRDRSLLVSGTVRSIDRDLDGGMTVRLSTGAAMDTVNAKLATRDDPTTLGVNRGREVSLLCVGRGAAIGAPLLGGCFVGS